MKASCITLIVLSSLCLLFYPFVMMGNIMAFANLDMTKNEPGTSFLGLYVFMWGTTLYPAAYLTALVGSIWCLRKKTAKAALFWQLGLIVYGLVTIGFFFAA